MDNDKVNRKGGMSRPRNLATLLSIIFPGLGQLYNRRILKAFLFFVIAISFLVATWDYIDIGIWGLFTLGTIPREHHSIQLLLQGLIALIVLVFGVSIYIFNIMDARKEAISRENGVPKQTLLKGVTSFYDRGFPYFMILPGLVMLIFIVVLPLLFMLTLAFTDYNQYNAPPRNLLNWVGFDNFTALMNVGIWKNTFLNVFTWTIVWTVVATTLQITLGLFLAILVNDKRVKFKRTIRTILILPWAVPAFVSILIFSALFNPTFGAINRDLLSQINVMIPWLSDPFWAKTALIMIQTWLGFPFVFALFTGVLQSVPADMYEAADVDGGSRWQKFRHITFPHLLYATAPLLIMQYAGNFNNFNIIYLFNEGDPAVRGQNAGGTDILISWVYKLTFETNNYNMAAAVTIIMGLLISVFAFFQFRKTAAFKEEGRY
ncbi:sugar ABC transporter permease [Virgibacillus sp. MG-45]|uniref:sugar ABC transporter permease n=1 Tax=Virgibacillus sp. MG-45 TaxID=3102791 RepID=UPI002ED8F8ED